MHIGTSFLKTKVFRQNSELLSVFSLLPNTVSWVKPMKFIQKKLDLGHAGSPQLFSNLSVSPLHLN